MSRIGKQPITIPDKVTLEQKANQLVVKSGNLELSQLIPDEIKLKITKTEVQVINSSASNKAKALHGLTRSLINNMIIGVTQGFTKTLELEGTGFRVNPKGESIEMSLGFSHPVVYTPPQGIKIEVKENKIITITGADKYLVGQTAANIRQLKPPDAYKGKGIRYQGEHVKLKPGKAAKAAGAE